MRILFVGLGSAGQRHLRNIYRQYGDKIEYLAYRSSDNQTAYSDDLQVIPNARLCDLYPLIEYKDYSKALAEKPDVVYICNLNNQHIEYAIKAVETGADVFIEKPLSVDFHRIDELESFASQKNSIIYLGYQQRLNPCIKVVKDLIDNKVYGSVIDVYAEVGEDVTKMHPYQDYHTMVEVKREAGGGAVSCQCHEIDYIQYLFGMPKEVLSIGGKRGDLEIDVEDNATSILKYEDEKGVYPVVVHQDYFQWPASRKFRIVFESATISGDLIGAEITVDENDGVHTTEEFIGFNRNSMFIEEDRLFMKAVEQRTQPFVSLQDGINDLKIIDAIKRSIKNGSVISLR